MEQRVQETNKPDGLAKMLKYRYLVWSFLAIAYLVVFFHRLAAGVVRLDLIQAFNITDSTFSAIGTTYFYVYLVMQIPTGMLVDSIGPRKTVTVGSLIAGVGSILFGSATAVPMLFVGRFLIGLGVSVIFVSTLKILSQWFKPSEFSTMTGITVFIGTMGGVIAQTPLAVLVENTSWRTAFIGIGIFSLFLTVGLYMFVRNTPAELGMPSVNDVNNTVKSNASQAPKQSWADLFKSVIIVMKNKRTWPIFFLYAGFYGAYVTMMGFWGTSYISDVYGLEKLAASKYIISGVFGSAVGSLVIGRISDYLGKRKLPMLIFGTLCVLSWFYIVVVTGCKPPIQWMSVIMFVLGFSGTGFVIGWAAGKEVNPPENVGVATAVVNMGGFFGSIAIPPLLARVFDTYMGQMDVVLVYQKAFSYSLAAVVIGLMAGLLVKETDCKNIYSK